jgi:hypothetical protein
MRCAEVVNGCDMSALKRTRRTGALAAAGGALAIAGYAAYVAGAWLRYGRAARESGLAADPLLDRFMPQYDVVERHHTRTAAPAEITLAAAAETSLRHSPLVRVIFRMRELVLGSQPDAGTQPKGLLAEMKSLGWRVLAEDPGREIVMGAVTQPWKGDVVFRGIPANEFVGFHESGYVKIAWTLRADPVSPIESVFRTETRVIATDPIARQRFRWYWARFSPGIVLIRRAMLGAVKDEAERRAAVHPVL